MQHTRTVAAGGATIGRGWLYRWFAPGSGCDVSLRVLSFLLPILIGLGALTVHLLRTEFGAAVNEVMRPAMQGVANDVSGIRSELGQLRTGQAVLEAQSEATLRAIDRLAPAVPR